MDPTRWPHATSRYREAWNMLPMRWLLIGVLSLASFGCASKAALPVAPPTVDVTGTWTGTWIAQGIGAGDAWATLRQSGAQVTGELTLNGTPDLNRGGPVEGTIEGNVLTFLWRSRNGHARGEFTVEGEEMSGSTQLLARLQWKLIRAK